MLNKAELLAGHGCALCFGEGDGGEGGGGIGSGSPGVGGEVEAGTGSVAGGIGPGPGPGGSSGSPGVGGEVEAGTGSVASPVGGVGSPSGSPGVGGEVEAGTGSVASPVGGVGAPGPSGAPGGPESFASEPGTPGQMGVSPSFGVEAPSFGIGLGTPSLGEAGIGAAAGELGPESFGISPGLEGMAAPEEASFDPAKGFALAMTALDPTPLGVMTAMMSNVLGHPNPTARGMTAALGMADRGVSAIADTLGLSPDPDAAPAGAGSEGGDWETMTEAPERQQTDQQEPRIPSMTEPPGWLRIPAGMTPLQRRAFVSTFGTQADDARYRTPEARDYYRRLALNTIGDGDFLPIEEQYIQRMFDRPGASGRQNLIDALQGA